MSCWHRWTNWQSVTEAPLKAKGDTRDPAPLVGYAVIQKRTCDKCGKVELRQQREFV